MLEIFYDFHIENHAILAPIIILSKFQFFKFQSTKFRCSNKKFFSISEPWYSYKIFKIIIQNQISVSLHNLENLHPSLTQLGEPQPTTISVHFRQKQKHLVLYKNHLRNNLWLFKTRIFMLISQTCNIIYDYCYFSEIRT